MEHKKEAQSSSPSSNADNLDLQLEELLQSLEQQTAGDGRPLYKYRGLWCSKWYLPYVLSFEKHFKPLTIDVLLVTLPKSGTTWLKALAFSIATRSIFGVDRSPLLTSNPHEVVPFLELDVFWKPENLNFNSAPGGPRILGTHLPLGLLPESILQSGCKIIYVCRNPLDRFVSMHRFLIENRFEEDAVQLDLDEAVDKFSQGVHTQGPFWDHILGYWNAHLKNPEKVMFLRYEDLKEDITSNVRKLAEFMECPISVEEEKQGVIEQISSLCSFDNLKSLEVNKTGNLYEKVPRKSFFRKGEVGDWSNHLSPIMARRMKKTMEAKFRGSGLVFHI